MKYDWFKQDENDLAMYEVDAGTISSWTLIEVVGEQPASGDDAMRSTNMG